MSIVTIILAKRKFKLACSDDSISYVEQLSERLDSELNIISKDNPFASFEMLLVMTALSLMDEKYSKVKELGGEALIRSERENHKQFVSIFNELKSIEKKF